MKKFLFLIIISAFPVLGFSQLPVLQHENFNTSNGLWSEYDNETASAKIKGGYYYMNNKTSSYIYRFYDTKYVNPNKDFEISAVLKQIAGAENYGYG